MGEFYTEQLVKRNTAVKDKLLKVLLIVLIILSLPLVLGYKFGFILLVLLVAVTVLVFMRTDVEYEYLYYNGDLDVDIIYRKSRRKRVFSMNVNEMEMLAPADSIEVKHYDRVKTEDYSSGRKDADKYAMIVSKNGAKVRIIFEPNEKVVEDLFYKAPRKVIRK